MPACLRILADRSKRAGRDWKNTIKGRAGGFSGEPPTLSFSAVLKDPCTWKHAEDFQRKGVWNRDEIAFTLFA